MKRSTVLVVALAVALNAAGCANLQKKFTRKKKAVKAPRIYQLKKYEKKPASELYKYHFAHWSSWQDELIDEIGENQKKNVVCVDGIVTHLRDMHGLLLPPKSDEFEKHVVRMEDVRDMITRGYLTQFNKDSVKGTLEREHRAIKRDFTYDKVKEYLIDTTVDSRQVDIAEEEAEEQAVEDARREAFVSQN